MRYAGLSGRGLLIVYAVIAAALVVLAVLGIPQSQQRSEDRPPVDAPF